VWIGRKLLSERGCGDLHFGWPAPRRCPGNLETWRSAGFHTPQGLMSSGARSPEPEALPHQRKVVSPPTLYQDSLRGWPGTRARAHSGQGVFPLDLAVALRIAKKVGACPSMILPRSFLRTLRLPKVGHRALSDKLPFAS
jgi:hypothetical protein